MKISIHQFHFQSVIQDDFCNQKSCTFLVDTFRLIFKVEKKTSPLLQRGSLPPSPNVSYWGYPPPSPYGETSFMDGPLL